MRIIRYQETSGSIHHAALQPDGSATLLPGTVILTGTPQDVGAAMKPPVFLQPGDSVTIEIEKIGALTNPVVAES
jgi:2-keto-4-pentenoate hydratase/2-oxohepta-3-ene-1,7-dioic acid hydratase in catechol pathway